MANRKTEGAEAARKKLPALLDQAHRGSPTIITKRGVPYAAIVPVSELAARSSGVGIRALRGSGKGLWGKDSAGAIEKLRREWR